MSTCVADTGGEREREGPQSERHFAEEEVEVVVDGWQRDLVGAGNEYLEAALLDIEGETRGRPVTGSNAAG